MTERKQEFVVESRVMDEDSLVEAARRDPQAFAELYRRYITPVYRYLYRRVDNPADAEDLAALVFQEVLEGLFHYRDQGNFASWLFTIAHHKTVDLYRSQRGHLPLDDVENLESGEASPPEQVERNQMMARMKDLIDQLDEDKQELLRLRFAASLTYGEIGNLLGRSDAAVKMAIHRILRHLNDEWERKS